MLYKNNAYMETTYLFTYFGLQNYITETKNTLLKKYHSHLKSTVNSAYKMKKRSFQ